MYIRWTLQERHPYLRPCSKFLVISCAVISVCACRNTYRHFPPNSFPHQTSVNIRNSSPPQWSTALKKRTHNTYTLKQLPALRKILNVWFLTMPPPTAYFFPQKEEAPCFLNIWGLSPFHLYLTLNKDEGCLKRKSLFVWMEYLWYSKLQNSKPYLFANAWSYCSLKGCYYFGC